MRKRPTISFSVDEKQLKTIKEYAKIKGFDKPSILARKALFSFISKNKPGAHRKRGRVSAPSSQGMSKKDQ